MAGDVAQWTEALIVFGTNSFRGYRGGSYDDNVFALEGSSLNRGHAFPTSGGATVGFRLAMTPEPSTLALATFGFIGLAAWGWRRNLVA